MKTKLRIFSMSIMLFSAFGILRPLAFFPSSYSWDGAWNQSHWAYLASGIQIISGILFLSGSLLIILSLTNLLKEHTSLSDEGRSTTKNNG